MREDTKGPVCERQTYSFVILLGRLFEGDGDLQRLSVIMAAADHLASIVCVHQAFDDAHEKFFGFFGKQKFRIYP